MGAEDIELEKIKLKKLAKMLEKKSYEKKVPEKAIDDRILSKHLYDRADEVLRAAEEQFPDATKKVKAALAQMYRSGRLVGDISGGELLMLFRSLGMPLSLNTHITIVEHGKAKSLQEKLKESLVSEY